MVGKWAAHAPSAEEEGDGVVTRDGGMNGCAPLRAVPPPLNPLL
jgi:hypothetical protein